MSEMNPVLDQEPPDPPDPPDPSPAASAPPDEEQDPTAGLTAAEEKLAALQNALTAARAEVRDLKPRAQKVAELEQQVNEFRPYVEFLRAHPQLLQPQPSQTPPASEPHDDPALVDLARTLELYDPQTGQPDVKRAAAIAKFTEGRAEQIAKQHIAPVQTATYEQRAMANIQHALQTTKTADGQPLDQQYLGLAITSIAQAMPREEALRLLADPKVMEVITFNALGLQSASKKGTTAPLTPPLHVESAGGARDVPLSDFSRRLAKAVGRSEKEWIEGGKRFNPAGPNSLE